jgi:hypothetical protein
MVAWPFPAVALTPVGAVGAVGVGGGNTSGAEPPPLLHDDKIKVTNTRNTIKLYIFFITTISPFLI